MMRAFIWYSILDRCIEYLAENVRINCSIVEIPDLYVGKRFSVIRHREIYPWERESTVECCYMATLKEIDRDQDYIYVEGESSNEWIDISHIIDWIDA